MTAERREELESGTSVNVLPGLLQCAALLEFTFQRGPGQETSGQVCKITLDNIK